MSKAGRLQSAGQKGEDIKALCSPLKVAFLLEVEASWREQPEELADPALCVSPGVRAVLASFLPLHKGRRWEKSKLRANGLDPGLGFMKANSYFTCLRYVALSTFKGSLAFHQWPL